MQIPEHIVAQWHKAAMSGTDEQGFGPNSCWGKFALLARKWNMEPEQMADSVNHPPPELVESLRSEAPHGIRDAGVTRERHLAIAAYRAGADAELEACCEWLTSHFHGRKEWGDALRDARRPKPPSLAEQALKALDEMEGPFGSTTLDGCALTLRAALERLQELENNG